MRYTYAVETEADYRNYRAFAERYCSQIDDYIGYLREIYEVIDVPDFIVWADVEMATKVFRTIAVPAYTNATRMVLTPDVSVWQSLYLAQLEVYDEDDERVQQVREHYQTKLSDRFLLQIVGHELTHNSEWFLDDYDANLDDGIWFEEGMVEYISRSYFLTDEEYQSEKRANELLVTLFEEKYGLSSLEDFGQATYDGSYASIFCAYWRSFLAVESLVARFGSVSGVFQQYHAWDKAGRLVPLSEWFQLTIPSG